MKSWDIQKVKNGVAKLDHYFEEYTIAAKSGLGMWAFLLHRLTGLSLLFYLLMHIIVISTFLRGPEAFNKLLAVLTSPPFLVADLALLAAILFHALNGIRILLFDLGIGIRWQKPIFLALMIPAAVIWLITAYLTIPHIF